MKLFQSFLDTSSRWYYLLHWLVIIILALMIYGQTFGFGFQFDDNQFIVQNPYIKDLSKIDQIWKILPWTRFIGIYSFALNNALGGLNPIGYHIFNLLIHLCVTGMVWALASLLCKITNFEGQFIQGASSKKYSLKQMSWCPQEIPFLIALIFLVHPCQTQAVTYVSQRFESMATLFYMLSVYFYLRARISTPTDFRFSFFVLSGSCAVLGILTKEVAVTIPVMLVALEILLKPFWRSEQSKKKSKLNKPSVYFYLLTGAFFFFLLFGTLVRSGLSIFSFTAPSESHFGDTITTWNYMLTQMRVFLTFLRLLVIPIHQNLDYDFPVSTGILTPPLTLIGLMAIGGIIFFIIKFKKQWPVFAFGLTWMLITFSINMAPRINIIFEHKLYLISFGFIIAVVVAAFTWFRQKTVLLVVFLSIIAFLSVLSFERNKVWQNEFTLWQDTLTKSPDKPRVYANLAKAVGTPLQYEQLLKILNEIINKKPNFYSAYQCRAATYHHLGRLKEAIDDIHQSIAISPTNFLDYYKLSIFYKESKDYEHSYQALTDTLRLNNKYKDAYVDRAVLLMRQNKSQEALEDLNKALSIKPNDFQALMDRGGVYFCINRYDLALKDISKAQSINPYHVASYKNLAYCLMKMGRLQEARANFEIALQMDPQDSKTRSMYEDTMRLLRK